VVGLEHWIKDRRDFEILGRDCFRRTTDDFSDLKSQEYVNYVCSEWISLELAVFMKSTIIQGPLDNPSDAPAALNLGTCIYIWRSSFFPI
jgi:hypothetical protein